MYSLGTHLMGMLRVVGVDVGDVVCRYIQRYLLVVQNRTVGATVPKERLWLNVGRSRAVVRGYTIRIISIASVPPRT